MKYQPMDMKMVLIKFNEALIAGRSEMDMVKRLHCYMVTSVQAVKRFNIVTFVTV